MPNLATTKATKPLRKVLTGDDVLVPVLRGREFSGWGLVHQALDAVEEAVSIRVLHVAPFDADRRVLARPAGEDGVGERHPVVGAVGGRRLGGVLVGELLFCFFERHRVHQGEVRERQADEDGVRGSLVRDGRGRSQSGRAAEDLEGDC